MQFGKPKIEVYDSCRGYATDERAAAVGRVAHIVNQVWKMVKQTVLKQTEQQPAGSNDCGVYTINNALRLSKAGTLVDRKSLIAKVHQRLSKLELFPHIGTEDTDPEVFFQQNPDIVRTNANSTYGERPLTYIPTYARKK